MGGIPFLYDTVETDLARDFIDYLEELHIPIFTIPSLQILDYRLSKKKEIF